MSPNSLYLEAFWENVQEKLKNELSKESYETWLAPTKLIDFANNNLTINVVNEFAKDWLESRYANLIKSTIQNYLNVPVTLSFVVDQDQDQVSSGFPIQTEKMSFGTLSYSLIPSILLTLLLLAMATGLRMLPP